MKKLLSLLCAISVITSSSVSLVACNAAGTNADNVIPGMMPVISGDWDLDLYGDPNEVSNIQKFYKDKTSFELKLSDNSENDSYWMTDHRIKGSDGITFDVWHRTTEGELHYDTYDIQFTFSYPENFDETLKEIVKLVATSKEVTNNKKIDDYASLKEYVQSTVMSEIKKIWNTNTARFLLENNCLSLNNLDIKAVDTYSGLNILPTFVFKEDINIKILEISFELTDYQNNSVAASYEIDKNDSESIIPIKLDKVGLYIEKDNIINSVEDPLTIFISIDKNGKDGITAPNFNGYIYKCLWQPSFFLHGMLENYSFVLTDSYNDAFKNIIATYSSEEVTNDNSQYNLDGNDFSNDFFSNYAAAFLNEHQDFEDYLSLQDTVTLTYTVTQDETHFVGNDLTISYSFKINVVAVKSDN